MNTTQLENEFHTGDTVTQQTMKDLIDSIPQPGVPLGVATLDANGQIPVSQLPAVATSGVPTTVTYTTVPSPCFLSQNQEVSINHGAIVNENYTVTISEQIPDATGITNTTVNFGQVGASNISSLTNVQYANGAISSKLRSDLTWFEDNLMLDFSTGAVIDHSINAINNWTANGNTFAVMFNSTTALHLNGTNISTPNNIALNPGTSNFTFSFWIYPSSVNKVIIPMPITGSIFPLLEINASSQVVLHSSTNALTVATPALTQGVWSFVTIGVKTNFVTPASAYGFACVQGNTTINYTAGADWNGGYNFNTNFQIGSTFIGYLAIFRFITKAYDIVTEPVPISTNLIPTMYSNTTYAPGTGSPTAVNPSISLTISSWNGGSFSSYDPIGNAWMIFNTTSIYQWSAYGSNIGNVTSSAIFLVDFGVPTRADSYIASFYCNAVSGSGYSIYIYLQGSLDNSNWTTLWSTTISSSITNDARKKPLPINSTFRYFRLNFQFSVVTTVGLCLQVYNFGLYRDYDQVGMPFPTYQIGVPTLIETTDANNFNLGVCSRIASIVIGGNIPSPTCVKCLVSFDKRNTWKYFTNGAWTTTTLNNINTTGMSVSAITSALKNYEPLTTDTYLDFAFQLQQEYVNTGAVSLTGVTITYDDTGAFTQVAVGSAYALTRINPTQTKLKKLTAGTNIRAFINLTAAIAPPSAVNNVNVVNSQATMLAIGCTIGTIAVRTDNNTLWILEAADSTVLANWALISNTLTVYSVNGKSGIVNLTAADFNAVSANSLATGAYKNISTGPVAPSSPKAGDIWIKTT